ncbi:MAG: pseudaminic acid biosynthesis-associated methylase [Syntrophales bacterium]
MMEKVADQTQQWSSEFGKGYTDRNPHTLEAMDGLYKKQFGLTRTELNLMFLGKLDRSIKILEVGSNVGAQLLGLQKLGFKNLYGIELQPYAVEVSKRNTQNINLIQGSALEIPFRDSYFALVFTSGVLIHINPDDLNMVMREIYRCTREYIWGFEYYADQYSEITYRGRKNLLWKANFAKLYLDKFEDLELLEEKRIKYLDNDNVDSMFLISKRSAKND